MSDLVSVRIRNSVREHLVDWTLATIGDLFTGEGFVADLGFDPPVSGQRREYVEQFYAAIDWSDPQHVQRYLRVVEQVLDSLATEPMLGGAQNASPERLKLVTLLERDGFRLDERGRLRPDSDMAFTRSVADLDLDSAIPGHLARMWGNVEVRPEQAISAAKDAMESAARHVLTVTGSGTTGKEKFPALCDAAQRAIQLHPTGVAPDAKGAESVRGILGGLSKVAIGVNEVRNLYGDGHGRAKRVSGLTERHARLVARCADAYVGILLDTLEAPGAPWRNEKP